MKRRRLLAAGVVVKVWVLARGQEEVLEGDLEEVLNVLKDEAVAGGDSEMEKETHIMSSEMLTDDDLVFCEECKMFHPIKTHKGKKVALQAMNCPETNKTFIVGVNWKLMKNRYKKEK